MSYSVLNKLSCLNKYIREVAAVCGLGRELSQAWLPRSWIAEDGESKEEELDNESSVHFNRGIVTTDEQICQG